MRKLLVIIIILFLIPLAHAQSIGSGTIMDTDGSNVVWRDNGAVFLNSEEIADYYGQNLGAKVDGDYVVWIRNERLHSYQISTGITEQISDRKAYELDLKDNRVVYTFLDGTWFDIALFDLTTGLETRLTNDQRKDRSPVIDEVIGWIGNKDVYIRENEVIRQLTNTPEHENYIKVHGSKLAWSSSGGTYVYDETVQQISPNYTVFDLGDDFVWEDGRDIRTLKKVIGQGIKPKTDGKDTAWMASGREGVYVNGKLKFANKVKRLFLSKGYVVWTADIDGAIHIESIKKEKKEKDDKLKMSDKNN